MHALLNAYLEEVKSLLKSPYLDATVVVMPDFFLDRFVSLNWNVKSFSERVADVAKRKGGSIDGIVQTEFRGGNAVNTASALANLGMKVAPIICTDQLGLRLIRFYVKNPRISFSHIKVFDKISITTALEFVTKSGRVNVMLRDLGSLADFGPKDLNAEDFKAVENADYVCIFNWAGTRSFGTELAGTVFRHVKTKGKGKTYFDTADPTPHKEKVEDLMKKVLQTGLVDNLSLNENEAVFYASQIGGEPKSLKEKAGFEDLAMESARFLASHLPARIDLHTTSFSATFAKKGETIVPAFNIPVLRATGAGDAWNAGNILGNICGMSDEVRLTLANAVAAFYISNPKGKHPTRKELIRFCNKLKGKQITKTDKN